MEYVGKEQKVMMKTEGKMGAWNLISLEVGVSK